MTSPWLTGVVPVVSALLGLGAGLASPLITAGAGRRSRRRDDQRARCDEILALFQDVNAVAALKDPRSGTRRTLLLLAVRITDTDARDACTRLVEQASRPDADDSMIIEQWTYMIYEIARVYRAAA